MPCTLKELSAQRFAELTAGMPKVSATASQRAAAGRTAERMRSGALFYTTEEVVARGQLSATPAKR